MSSEHSCLDCIFEGPNCSLDNGRWGGTYLNPHRCLAPSRLPFEASTFILPLLMAKPAVASADLKVGPLWVRRRVQSDTVLMGGPHELRRSVSSAEHHPHCTPLTQQAASRILQAVITCDQQTYNHQWLTNTVQPTTQNQDLAAHESRPTTESPAAHDVQKTANPQPRRPADAFCATLLSMMFPPARHAGLVEPVCPSTPLYGCVHGQALSTERLGFLAFLHFSVKIKGGLFHLVCLRSTIESVLQQGCTACHCTGQSKRMFRRAKCLQF